MFSRTKYAATVARERPIAPFIPQRAHLTPDTIIAVDGDLQRTYKLSGTSFETADVNDIHALKEQLNTLIRSVASSNVALWQHTIQRKTTAHLPGEFDNRFCREFNYRYIGSLNSETMMLTELYLTVVYRPTPSKTGRLLVRAGRRRSEEIKRDQQQAVAALDKIARQVESGLEHYDLDVLQTYTNDNGVVFSDALSFLHYLVSGHWQKVRVPNGPLNEYLGNAWLHAGTETIEIRTPYRTQYAQAIELKDYNEYTEPGIFDGLLYADYEMVITQSFSLLDKHKATDALKTQRRHLQNVEDDAVSQVDAITQAIDDLGSGHFALGEYHFSMMVFGDDVQAVRDNVNSAVRAIENQGFIATLATTATEATFYAQLPCNWALRPRIATLTSRNYAGMAALHNFPHGKQHGNPWGDAVTLFKTTAGQPLFFNFHHGIDGVDTTGRKMPANTRIIGKTGTGKTALLNTLLVQSQKYDNRGPDRFSTVFFDKDHGAKLAILAIGGKYLTLKTGKPTGFNPFQMQPTEHNINFLERLITWLAEESGHPLTTSDELRISQGIRTVMDMPLPLRRMSVLLQNITEGTDAAERQNSVVKRLAKWCADDGSGKRGALWWVLDCEHDQIDFTTHHNVGIDGTDFLKNEQVRTPIMMYLLHRMNEVIDGRRFINFMDEAFTWLDAQAFAESEADRQATIRKKHGFSVMATQSPRTVLDSSIATALLEQVATEIYLPNPKATRDDYVKGFGCTDAEFDVIKTLPENSHMFVVKQGSQSVVAWLDLDGFGDDLAILAPTTDDIRLAETIMNDVGTEPDKWISAYLQNRKQPSLTKHNEVAA